MRLLSALALCRSLCRFTYHPLALSTCQLLTLLGSFRDKCGNAPKGNCADPDYKSAILHISMKFGQLNFFDHSIKTAAQYFAMTLAANKGDLLRSMGTYNG
jgi:hypothetical protein